MILFNPDKPRRAGSFKVTDDTFEYVNAHGKVLRITERGAPNLDATPPDTLMSFWHAGYIGGWKLARFLFPDRPKGYVTATGALIGYASNKATAMSCRENGNIQGALIYERICDDIYEQLPEYARW